VSSRSEVDALERMRAVLPVLMRGTGALPQPIPLGLIQANHLGPLAYGVGATQCREEYAASTIMSLRRRALLDEVLLTLSERELSTALLKGIAYVDTIYANAAERPMNDIDLLVRPAQLPDVMRAMLDLGFERVGMSRKLSGYYHAIPFHRDGVIIEMHRNIMQPHRTAIRMGDIWKRAVPDSYGTRAKRLDPVDELLLCIMHIARHELAVPAINYVDVWRSRARLDATQLATLRERATLLRVSRAVTAVESMTDMLASGERGHPALGTASRLLPSTDDVLLAVRPRRLRQISQKLSLLEGPRELAGLGYVYATTYFDGLLRTRR
jgi:hypothetical protein